MRLLSLGLRNFRQHADTQVEFATGLTGIIGANGAGKTTLLEAIAWALYGNSAARGTRDSLRHARAPENAAVRVQLDFALGGHRYRVERTLRTAEVYLDGGAEPVARTIRGVNDLLQRRLGMSRSEFFHTYFTGQKELDVMAALGPVERARFLARVLGYDRLGAAQEMLRERRRTLIAELSGLRSGMPDADAVTRRVSEAEDALATARDRREISAATLADAEARLAAFTPQWQAAEQGREQWQALEADRRVLGETLQALRRDVERLDAELREVTDAGVALAPLVESTRPLAALREELERLDSLAAAEGERRALAERQQGLHEEERRVADRLEKLESAPGLEQEQRVALEALQASQREAAQAHEEARTLWVRDRQEAETRLEALRLQHEELSAQQEALQGLGEESPCPTCGRPLGASFREVLAQVTEQLDTVKVDGSYFRQRVRQLATAPERVAELDARRLALQQEGTAAERRYLRIQAALAEREQLAPQLEAVRERSRDVQRALDALPTGYDADRHRVARAEVARLQALATRAAQLEATVAREPSLRERRLVAERELDAVRTREAALVDAAGRLAFDPAVHETLRQSQAQAAEARQQAERALAQAEGVVERALQERDTAVAARASLDTLRARAAQLEGERSLHDELDDAYGALREELNAGLRPELSELASALLEALTDGRYAALELDEQYAVQVLEDGLPKTVLSGGEEDLCNLVLRLAISQMIAERAGQPFSLLILDEVFGSLDEARRENVLALLRRLHDRFEQVIVITHIEDVREGLDRVLTVTYDAESGSSRVHASLGGAAGAEASAWEAEAVGLPSGELA